jgi:hypothetical protein
LESPPNSVILTLEDGTNQQFKIPKGQKFTVDGQETDAFGLKKGMNVSATKIVEVPETEVEHQRQLTGSMPPPPPPPPADAPILIAQLEPAPAPAAPAELPKTGSLLPLIGLRASLLSSFGGDCYANSFECKKGFQRVCSTTSRAFSYHFSTLKMEIRQRAGDLIIDTGCELVTCFTSMDLARSMTGHSLAPGWFCRLSLPGSQGYPL